MRQLLISSGGTVAYDAATGLLAPGAIDVVGLSADGPTTLAPGQTISDFAAIRLIQGTTAGVANVVSPWIDGTSVSRWAGQSFVAQTAQNTTWGFTTNPTAGTEFTCKVIDRSIGQAPFTRKSATYTAVTGDVVGNVVIGIMESLTGLSVADGTLAAGVANVIPGMGDRVTANINSIAAGAATTITLVGTTFAVNPYNTAASFESANENLDGAFGTVIAVTAVAAPAIGNGGDGNFIVELETSLQGMGRGFYNRIQLPNTPPAYAVAATTYDLYKLGFGNAEPGSIRGVDNYREITIAAPAGDADGAIFENKINPWLNSCPGSFAAVVL